MGAYDDQNEFVAPPQSGGSSQSVETRGQTAAAAQNGTSEGGRARAEGLWQRGLLNSGDFNLAQEEENRKRQGEYERKQAEYQARGAFDPTGTEGHRGYQVGMNASAATGRQQDALGRTLYDRMHGIGQSPAEQQYRQGVMAAQSGQKAIGASARGIGSAGAVRAGSGAAAQIGVDAQGSIAQLRAQEQIDARKQYADMLVSQRQAELQASGLGVDYARQMAENEMAQREMNDQMTQNAIDNELNYYTLLANGLGAQQSMNLGQAQSSWDVNQRQKANEFTASDFAISTGGSAAQAGAYYLAEESKDKDPRS